MSNSNRIVGCVGYDRKCVFCMNEFFGLKYFIIWKIKDFFIIVDKNH